MEMNPSLLALLIYAAWTLVLVGTIATYRSLLTVTGSRQANSFAVDGTDISPFSQRLCRAHANCYENLGVFAGVVLVAQLSGHAAITDPLALWVAAARIGQSAIHVASTSNPAVTVRFAMFVAQWGIIAWWVVQLALVAV